MPKSLAILRRLLPLCVVVLGGCTGVSNYFHNGCKVGPNYHPSTAPVAHHWIDANDKRVRTSCDDLSGWWTVFDDPLLNDIVLRAYNQNLTLREAGYRVLAARAQLGIASGNFFPQTQNSTGSYRRIGAGGEFFDQWNLAFNLAWELDFWGRFRRAIISTEAALQSSVFDYEDATVTLLSDTATAYVNIRTTQERIRLLDIVIGVQEEVLRFIEVRVRQGGKGTTTLDRAQALSNLEQSRAQRNQFLIDLRTAENQLCILLGMPAVEITDLLATGPKTSIPLAPDYVVVGIPANLLARRPDVRRAERDAAAQAEQIGIAETDWYPAISISGTLGWQARNLSDLFRPESFNSNVGPSFEWNLLNYGRILNNVRLQDAQFLQLVTAYQNTVLQADLEVENGIVTFIQAHERADNLRKSVDQSWLALQVIVAQYRAGLGGIDFNRYATIEQNLLVQQDQWAQARGQIALGLIEVYRGLGGGWQIKCSPPPDKRGILSPPPGPVALPKPTDDNGPNLSNPATSPVDSAQKNAEPVSPSSPAVDNGNPAAMAVPANSNPATSPVDGAKPGPEPQPILLPPPTKP
ncbi:MAG TPA: efflux transporter outer membrane subunit [Lacipirellulaceae bacterium]|nr:efflux transporter outer membrane subunit [Lacipirellulaceae bacterium]